jgi:hypothetical protein
MLFMVCASDSLFVYHFFFFFCQTSLHNRPSLIHFLFIIFFSFCQTIDLLCSAYIQAGLGSRPGEGGELSAGGRGGGQDEVTEREGRGEGGGSRFVKCVIQVCVCVYIYTYI